MSQKQKVVAPLLCDLTGELGGRVFHQLCIGAKRDVLILSTDKGGGKQRTRIDHWHNGVVQKVDLLEETPVFHWVGAMVEGYLCVAGRWTREGREEHNAFLFDPHGIPLRSWYVGKGIADVQITPKGRKIWVSYFDEGVLNGEGQLAQQGLNCFNAQGEHIFGFARDIDKSPDLGSIIDCYSLNITSDRDTWLCYYTGFPIVHLRDLEEKERFQPPPEAIGTSAFTVHNTQRLFVGGYKHENQLFWRDEASKRQVEIEVVDENGDAVTWKRAHGRGADLFLCDDAKVHILSLNEIGF